MISVGARETLLDLIDEITVSLEELQKCEESGELDLYGEGAKAAFVQILEFVQQRWDEGPDQGLDFDIEEHFPVWRPSTIGVTKFFLENRVKNACFFSCLCYNHNTNVYGDMAQLVERYVRNVQATSSNLVISTSVVRVWTPQRRITFSSTVLRALSLKEKRAMHKHCSFLFPLAKWDYIWYTIFINIYFMSTKLSMFIHQGYINNLNNI